MNTNLPKYCAYQPTESEWLSEIPVGWKAIQLARLNNKLTNGFVGATRDILCESGVRYLQSLHIKGGRIVFDMPYFVSPEWSASHQKSVLKPGDVLIVQTGDIGQVAAVTEEFAGCNCHALIIVSAKPKMINGFFLSAVLRSRYGFHSLKSVQTGALHPHLNCTNIRDIYLPVPPLEEQRAILAFLDRETHKIDRLMDSRRKQIERLLEQRTATVYNAVTKGLGSDTDTRSSGVCWLGEVNADWQPFRIKHLADVIGGGTPKSDIATYWDGDIVWLTPSDLGKGVGGTISCSERTITTDGKAAAGLALLPEGSVVISTRAPVGSLGILGVAATTNQGCKGLVLDRRKADPRYFFYLLSLGVEFMKSISQGATFVELSGHQLKNLAVACPDILTQQKIADWLDKEVDRFEVVLTQYRRELELLAEYRASLISHAVTGKIDVRGFAMPVAAKVQLAECL